MLLHYLLNQGSGWLSSSICVGTAKSPNQKKLTLCPLRDGEESVEPGSVPICLNNAACQHVLNVPAAQLDLRNQHSVGAQKAHYRQRGFFQGGCKKFLSDLALSMRSHLSLTKPCHQSVLNASFIAVHAPQSSSPSSPSPYSPAGQGTMYCLTPAERYEAHLQSDGHHAARVGSGHM